MAQHFSKRQMKQVRRLVRASFAAAVRDLVAVPRPDPPIVVAAPPVVLPPAMPRMAMGFRVPRPATRAGDRSTAERGD